MRISAPVRIILGLLLGIALGLLMSQFAAGAASSAADIAKPIGKLWLAALQMTIVPLVACMLIVGVNAARDAAASGRVARNALFWILGVLTAAAVYAALLAPLLLSIWTPSPELLSAMRNSSAELAPASTGLGQWFAQIVPTNAIAAAAQGAIVPLVVFALSFAFALTRIEEKRRALMVEACQAVADTMIVIVHGVLWLAPLGVFALIFPVAAEAGASVLGALSIYIGMQCLLYALITVLLYGLATVGRGESLRRFAPAILPAQVVAASTQSSLASLPAMIEVSTKGLGYTPSVVGLVMPMAVSLFRITSPIQYLGVISFIAWSFGIDLSLTTMVTVVLLAVVISIGSVGLPGQASFLGTNLPMTQAAGLPTEPLGLLLAVDLVPDIIATVGNVTADLTVTSRVARSSDPTTNQLGPSADG